MRKTFRYLANVIIQNYKDEWRACYDCWEIETTANAAGDEKRASLYRSLRHDHARKADALLKIIIDEKLATLDGIAAINTAIAAEARAN